MICYASTALQPQRRPQSFPLLECECSDDILSPAMGFQLIHSQQSLQQRLTAITVCFRIFASSSISYVGNWNRFHLKTCSTPLLVPTTLIEKEDTVSLVLRAFFRVITRCAYLMRPTLLSSLYCWSDRKTQIIGNDPCGGSTITQE